MFSKERESGSAVQTTAFLGFIRYDCQQDNVQEFYSQLPITNKNALLRLLQEKEKMLCKNNKDVKESNQKLRLRITTPILQ